MVLKAYPSELSVKDAIALAIEHNHELKWAQRDVTLAHMQVDAQRQAFYPTALFSTYVDSEHAENGLFAEDRHSAGFAPKINWTTPLGTKMHMQYVSGVEHRKEHHHEWRFTVEQPLLKGLNLKANLADLEVADIQLEMSQRAALQQKGSLIYSVIHQYTNLLNGWSSFQLQRQRYQLQKELAGIVDTKIEQGVLAPIDAKAFEVRLAKMAQHLEISQLQLRKQTHQLSELIGMELDFPTQALPFKRQGEQPSAQIILESSINWAIEPLQAQVDALKYQKLVLEDRRLWDLNLSFQWSKGRQSYRYDQDEAFGYDPFRHIHAKSNRYVGLSLTVPLLESNNKAMAEYQNASSTYKKQDEIERVRVKVAHAIELALETVHVQKKLHAIALKAHEVAKQRLSIEQTKYLQGQTSFNELQQALDEEYQCALDVQRQSLMVILALVELDYQSGQLEKNWINYV